MYVNKESQKGQEISQKSVNWTQALPDNILAIKEVGGNINRQELTSVRYLAGMKSQANFLKIFKNMKINLDPLASPEPSAIKLPSSRSKTFIPFEDISINFIYIRKRLPCFKKSVNNPQQQNEISAYHVDIA